LVLGCTSSGKTPQEWEDKASRHMVLRVKSCIHTHTHTHTHICSQHFTIFGNFACWNILRAWKFNNNNTNCYYT
jgi:hypothetical protein